MKAITLWQPWASLMAIGAKRVETRSWRAPGSLNGDWIAIHAGASLGAVGGTHGLQELCKEPWFRYAFEESDYCPAGVLLAPLSLPLGAIVAVARFRGCQRLTARTPLPPYPERAFGDYRPGRWLWYFGDIHRLPEPVPARGLNGLWEWIPPDGLLAEIGIGGLR